MKASSRCHKNSKNDFLRQDTRGRRGSGRKVFLPALVALGGGCGFLAGPASALELGELKVHSSLGQPLRASVAYALQPSEQIHDYCIYLKPGFSADGLPSPGTATIAIRDGAIRLTGQAAIREPLLSLQLTVDCPYTAHLRREYSVFLDPHMASQQVPATPAVAAAPEAAPVRAASVQNVRRPVAAARPVVRAPVTSSGSYRVRPGDSLSVIAASIPNRSVAIWPAAEALFAANPDAFIDNDMNRLRAGAVLLIPDSLVEARPSATPAVLSTQAAPAATAEPAPAATPGVDGSAKAVATPLTGSSVTATGMNAGEFTPVQQVGTQGENASESDGPFKTPIDIDAPVHDAGVTVAPSGADAPKAVEKVASSAPAATGSPATSESWSWLIWLAGSGVALILGLLLFGRKLKARFAPDAFERRRTDSRNLDDTDIAPMRGLPEQGTASVARMVSLDADLEDGSGFQYGGDIDVAQDFGFSENSGEFRNRLDMDLTAADGGTDIIPTRRVEEATILVSETPPQHEDSGEYDVSMIVDATKQMVEDEDDTTKDLRAVEVDAEEDDTVSDEYTLDKDVDYKILEQDYEDEMTATQALNAEIARAARALSKQFGKDEMGDTLTDTMNDEMDATAAADFGEAFDEVFDDKTSQLQARDEAGADDATTALPTAGTGYAENDETTQLSVSSTMTLDDTANEEIALEVPAAENDSSVEVEVESALIDTKKMRA
ncbi:MAG TPA: hypothetical protein VKZ91_05420 [Woeseiaceae bacterium]|nr:hypothetical protein [Woeseiaceae bacterium]